MYLECAWILYVKPVTSCSSCCFVVVQSTAIPKASEFKVDSFQFDDFSLEPDQMLQASVRMFMDCGFIDEFHIDYEVGRSFKSSGEKHNH